MWTRIAVAPSSNTMNAATSTPQNNVEQEETQATILWRPMWKFEQRIAAGVKTVSNFAGRP
jgi:hypothetical protein